MEVDDDCNCNSTMIVDKTKMKKILAETEKIQKRIEALKILTDAKLDMIKLKSEAKEKEKVESEVKKILDDVLIKVKDSNHAAKKSSDDSAFGRPRFPKTLFFIWSCLIVYGIAMIVVGNHNGPKQDKDQAGREPSIPIGLQIEGTSFLLLALTFPLIYKLSQCCKKVDSVLARYLGNLAWLLLLIEILASAFFFLFYTLMAVIGTYCDISKISFFQV